MSSAVEKSIKMAMSLSEETRQALLKTLEPSEDSKIEELLEERSKMSKNERKKVDRKLQKKDPKHPKRYTGAFFYYINSGSLKKVKENHPDLSHKDAMRLLGKEWADLPDASKQPFVDMETSDKARYEKEMETYVPSEGFKKKSPKDPNRRKKPCNAYIHFTKQRRPELAKTMDNQDIMAELGKEWKAMSEEDRKPFVKMAQKEKEAAQKANAAEKKTEERKTKEKKNKKREREEPETPEKPETPKQSTKKSKMTKTKQ